MGFGVGYVDIIYIGGILKRCEYIPVGSPLTQAFQSEHHATGGGGVIVSTEVWSLIKDSFIGERLPADKNEKYETHGPFTMVHKIKEGK
jgi:adenylate cyclase 10